MEQKDELLYRHYASTYQSVEHSDSGRGVAIEDRFLVINSSGYYDGVVPAFPVYRPNGRRDFFFSYNHSGKIYVSHHGETLEMNQGDVLIFCPGESQHYWYDKTDYVKNYWIHFTGYGAQKLISQLEIPSGIPYHIGFTTEIGDLIEKIILEINGGHVGSQLYAVGILVQMLALVSRRVAENLPENIAIRNEHIFKVQEFIKAHYHQKLLIRELAAMSYLSANRFTNVFHELIGVTPQRYITDLRLQKSIELMKMTDWNIHQIAEAVGYEDQAYFSRLFKKYTQMSPTDFLLTLRGQKT